MVSLGSLLMISARLKKLDKQIKTLELSTDKAKNERENIQKQLAELHSGAVGLGHKFVGLEIGLDKLSSQQQSIADYDPDTKLYSRAVRMVELGAELDEVMAECELPKAEAELLLSLHSNKR